MGSWVRKNNGLKVVHNAARGTQFLLCYCLISFCCVIVLNLGCYVFGYAFLTETVWTKIYNGSMQISQVKIPLMSSDSIYCWGFSCFFFLLEYILLVFNWLLPWISHHWFCNNSYCNRSFTVAYYVLNKEF